MQLATSGFFVFGQPIVSLEKRREISHLPQRLIFLLLVVDQVLGSLDSLFLQKFNIKTYFLFFASNVRAWKKKSFFLSSSSSFFPPFTLYT